MLTDRLLPLLLVLSFGRTVQSACNPAEEGKPTILTCDVNTASCVSTALTWRAYTVSGSVAVCKENVCGGQYIRDGSFSASYTSSSSTLTINSVSRSTPFNMENGWTCRRCGQASVSVTACDKLEVYALPENPECTVSEDIVSGDISSVTVSCSTSKVYPEARCSFYHKKNGGDTVHITDTTRNGQPLPGVSPVYYRSSCSVSVSVSELGEGTQSFQGYIYPDVTGARALVNVIEPSKTVTLSVPGPPSISCSPDMVDGYFRSKSASCVCSLTSDGYPRGRAQWYRNDGQTVGSGGDLDVVYDKNAPKKDYRCEGISFWGDSVGSTALTVQFAFFEPSSVGIGSSTPDFNLCGSGTNNQVVVTCQVSIDDVSPAPTFSFSLDGLAFETSVPGTNTGTHYQGQYYPNPTVGGEYQVTCRVTNTVLPNTRHDSQTTVIFRQPPPLPPQVTLTVEGQTQAYQGVDPSNTVTLAESYTGDVTCRVEGGYPDAHNTQLKCGNLEGSVDGKTSTLSFTAAPLTRDMNGTVCTCTSQHDSGCYSNRETRLTLNVVYPPEVTFTQDPPNSQPLKEGDNLELTCSVQGNPDPTSVTLTSERTSDVVENVQTTKLTHAIDPLSCLDTGLYICSGLNSQGTTTESISVEVRCPQQFLPTFDPPPDVGAVINETAHIDLEIYGFPEPRALTLSRIDSTDLTSSPRHSVKYTAREAPLGFVNVTISDIIDTDYTNYTLTVDNGEGEALTYSFYLYEVNATVKQPIVDGGGSDNGVIIGVVVGVVVIVILVVVVVVMVLHRKGVFGRKNKSREPAVNGKAIHDPDEVVIPNPVYGDGAQVRAVNGKASRDSEEVVIPNPVYGDGAQVRAVNEKASRDSEEVVIPNPVYGDGAQVRGASAGGYRDSDEVVIPNPVYASSSDVKGRRRVSAKLNQYRDYTQLQTTMTSAMAPPTNLSKNDVSTYEDVGNVEHLKSKSRPAPAPKPKTSVAPKSPKVGVASPPGAPPTSQVDHTGPLEEPYAIISQTSKLRGAESTPRSVEDEEEEAFPDPATRPDVPAKQFEERGSDVPEQLYGNYPSLAAVTGGGSNPAFHTGEEDSVYANSGKPGVRN